MRLSIAKYLLLASLGLLIYIFVLAFNVKFEDRFAYLLFADDQIINAQVSEDEQWRIRCDAELPTNLGVCLKLFEDQYFDYHPGVNPVSLWKAFRQNLKHKKIKRGGSTITMQLARIHEGNKKRTYFQKLHEILLAFAMELRYSKENILKRYAQHAPYGGNTVGYCAAAFRYYGKDADQLTWSESATLAVLPNAPSKIYPGKSQLDLIRKRNFLLDKLLDLGYIDSISCRLSKLESLPTQSNYFESLGSHLLQELKTTHPSMFNYQSTLDYGLQKNALAIVSTYQKRYSALNEINNAAAIILRRDGSVAAYIGNKGCSNGCGAEVDILNSLRSPGSTLKPFLYGLSMDEGKITSSSLLKDIPVFYKGYSPANFDKKFRGIVRTDRALTESLNIPAIELLSHYGVDRFLDELKGMQFSGLTQNANHYGLSLILGGAEIRGRDLAKAYMNLNRRALGQKQIGLSFLTEEGTQDPSEFPLSIAASNIIQETLKGVHRPFNQDGWKYFENSKEISWKTGTSYGMRDAWAVGSSGDYTILVWIGNADGEGKAGLTGVAKAGPLLFELFDLLPNGSVAEIPLSHFISKKICIESGFAAGTSCTSHSLELVPAKVDRIAMCTFHQMITTDTSGQFRVNRNCDTLAITSARFILDPVTNSYFEKHTGLSYALPPKSSSCEENKEQIHIVYPSKNAEILLPMDIDKQKQSLVSEVLVDANVDSLFWFIDNELTNISVDNHKLELDLDPGEHVLTVVSSDGAEDSRSFTVLE